MPTYAEQLQQLDAQLQSVAKQRRAYIKGERSEYPPCTANVGLATQYLVTLQTGESRTQTVRALIQRDGDVCQLCFDHLDNKKRTIDHIHPRSLGGTNALENLQLVCQTCNSRKGWKIAPPLND